MEFRHIQYFITLTRYHSISRAAQELYISQQALSKIISKLEEEVGVKLLVRSKNGIRLTEDGIYLKEQFEKICSDFETTSMATYEYFGKYRGTIEFYASHGLFRSISTEPLLNFRKKYPDLELEIYDNMDLDCEDYVKEEPGRFALSTKPWFTTDLQYYPFHEEPLYLIAHKDHPLSGKEEICLLDLKNESFLFFGKRYNIHYQVMELCRNRGFIPNIVYKSSDLNQLVRLVKQNRGILLCVKHAYEDYSHEDMVCIPLADEDTKWECGLICQEFEALGKNEKMFFDFLMNELKK